MLALSPHKIALVILWTIVFHTLFTKTCTSTCNYDYPYHCHHHSYNYLFASVSGKIRVSLWLPLQDPDESLEEKKGCQAALKFWILCYLYYTNSPWPHRPELVEPLLPMGELMHIQVKKSCLPLQSILSNKLSATPQGPPLRVTAC